MSEHPSSPKLYMSIERYSPTFDKNQRDLLVVCIQSHSNGTLVLLWKYVIQRIDNMTQNPTRHDCHVGPSELGFES